MNEDFLEHYGTKGMKWGVRKSSTKSSKSSPAEKAAKLSDSDLKAKVNRLNMEKQYISLTSEKAKANRSILKKGSEYVGSVVKENADMVVRRGSRNVIKIVVDKYSKDAGAGLLAKIIKSTS